MGGSRKQTVGYRYHLGMHMVVCHGPVDAVTEIQVGDRQAWSGSITASGRIDINAPQLFGGDKREGGVYGPVDVAFGGATQAPNDYLQARLGTPQPAYRGVLSLILRQVCVASNNPYIKPWAVRLKRCWRGWYPGQAEIMESEGDASANPAHIIYECLTNPSWGMGYPASSIDDASFTAAADTLSDEGFGLNLIWTQQSTIEQFIREVLDHIGGVLTTSPSTGRFVLRLVRADYSVATLPVLDPYNVIELESFQRAAWGETVNEIVVVYTDRETFKDATVTVQDLANIQAQGAVVSQTRRYPGITSPGLAARVAMRDLSSVSAPLAKVRLKVNRKAWSLAPGDVFRLEWPPLGIGGIVMRIAAVDGGTLTDGAISIDAVEDVFGLPQASYTAPPPTGWVDPTPAPSAASPRRLIEAPYWDIARSLSAADLAYLDPTDCFLQTLAGRPAAGAINYELHSKTSSATSYEARGPGEFAPHAVLASAIGQAVTSTISYHSEVDIDLVAVGSYAYINDEAVAITAINTTAKTLTINRGVLDTVPAAHAAGSLIWFADGFQGVDATEYATGETVNARLLTVTGRGTLSLTSAPTDSLAMNRRQNRPYPPGDMRMNGAAYPQSVSGDLVITWAHRDRLSQTVSLTPQSAASIGPEPGTTYTVRVRDRNGTVVRTQAGLTATSWTWTVAAAATDAATAGDRVTVEIESVRDGLASWQAQACTVERAGWGLRWGQYWGGV